MTADWIAVGWGTSTLRAWPMRGAEPMTARVSDRGVDRLGPDGFEPALLELVGGDLPAGRATPVIVCGMAGARQSWAEAPCAAAPCAPPGLDRAARPVVRDTRLDIRILPGVSQSDPPDVMRGEETRIAGFMAANPRFDGVICLPGTHSKWVQVSAGEIVSFRSFMTGELFALLSRQSVLRHALSEDGWQADAFAEALADAMTSPQQVSARLFGLHAASLLAGLPPAAVRARLSGLLIGLELAGARGYWLGQNVALVGTGPQADVYSEALAAQGVAAMRADAHEMALAGLCARWQELAG